MSLNTQQLTNWHFRRLGSSDEWCPSHDPTASTTEIFPDLIAHGLIPDPYKDTAETDAQWVGETDWEYTSKFDVSEFDQKKLQLALLGLDTLAEVFLNEVSILKTENMFREYIVHLDPSQLKNGTNELRIAFTSPYKVKQSFVAKSLISTLDSSRMFVRKAQYHYGWDWGPILTSCGIYKPVELRSYDTTYLKDVFVDYKVTDTKTGTVEFTIRTTLSDSADVVVEHTLSDNGQEIWSTKQAAFGLESVTDKTIIDLELWYPHTHGSPKLYTVTSTVTSNGTKLSTRTRNIGFRKSEVIQEEFGSSEPGTSFYFMVNDIPIYVNGTNWIPAHNYLTTITHSHYEKWISRAITANQNMLRIWGGGIYESDSFYETTDQLGLLVWQDFMFACGQYPGDDAFRANLQFEVDQQLVRLRQYCSLVIWAGNNEDYVLYEEAPLSEKEFYARVIYEEQLAQSVERLHSNAAYIKGSPFSPGNDKSCADSTVGDVHEWNVWHGNERDYQEWPELAARFVSEFGMLGFPNLKTYKENITDDDEFFPQSKTVEMHCKALGFEKKLTYYIWKNLRVRGVSLEDWIYYSQLVQAESNHFALNGFRRRWGTDGNRRTGGQLVWQLNDCYPVASWAIMDHYLRPKLGYYRLKRDSAPIVVGTQRAHVAERYDNQRGYDGYRIANKAYTLDGWISNASLNDISGVVEVTMFDILNSSVLSQKVIDSVTIGSNSSVDVFKDLSLPSGAENIVVHVEFKDGNNDVVSSSGDWPQPLKYCKFSPDTSVQYETQDGRIKIWSDFVVKAAEIQLQDIDSVFLHDNGVDLFPGIPVEIVAEGMKAGDSVDIRLYT